MVTIKSSEEIILMQQAGLINYECHKYLASLIKPGVTTAFLNEEADKYIRQHGGIPSFLNYDGYPGAICTSLNDEVVHGIPSDTTLKEGDIISLDIGVIYQGYHSDSANTYPVGKVDSKVLNLISKTKEALYAGINMIKPGAYLGDISSAIEKVAKDNHYGVIRELVGHGVGKDLHEDPDIPNYGQPHTGIVLEPGMVLAIEPMFNMGSRKVYLLDDDWTIVSADGRPSAHFEHTVLVTDTGYQILTGE